MLIFGGIVLCLDIIGIIICVAVKPADETMGVVMSFALVTLLFLSIPLISAGIIRLRTPKEEKIKSHIEIMKAQNAIIEKHSPSQSEESIFYKVKSGLNYLLQKKQAEIETIKENLNSDELEIEKTILSIEPYNSQIEPHLIKLQQYEKDIPIYEENIRSNQQSITYLQRQQEELKRQNAELEINNLQRLDGWQFETYCANLFRKLGYSVRLTKGSGDFGADLILNNSISVQCKLYANPVGLHALQEVFSSMARYKTTSAWVITNSTFTKQAIEYAKDANIKLIDHRELKILISKVLENSANQNSELADKLQKLRVEYLKLHSDLKELKTKIFEEKKEIDKIKAQMSDIPKVIELRKKATANSEQAELKINTLSAEIQEIKSELDYLSKFGACVANELAKKYNFI